MSRRIGFLAGLFLVLLGCSANDPKIASKDNFERLLREPGALVIEDPCFHTGRFPLEIKHDPLSRFPQQSVPAAAYDSLVAAGLLRVTAEYMAEPNLAERRYPVRTYDVTATGRPFYRDTLPGNYIFGSAGFCAGRAELASVASFSEPAEGLGVRQSSVKYKFLVRDVAPWASRPGLQPFFGPTLRRAVDGATSPHEGQSLFVLESDGWKRRKLESY
jgi:hypothetical protein